jgi:hypothetical protein
MLWLRIVVALVLLVIATYLIQWLVPRRGAKANRRQYLRWDVAPIVGFFGALLLALSFALAVQSDAVVQWGWGFVFGFVVSVLAWTLGIYRQNQTARKRAGIRQIVRRYVPLTVAVLAGVYLAVRVFGAVVEVFAVAALGVFVLAFAVTLFVGNRPEITEGK